MHQLLKKILAPCHMEYMALTSDLRIIETSLNVDRLADSPQEVKPGKDVRLAFPELVGCEEILLAVLQKQQASFDIKGIARSTDNNSPLYIDLYVSEYQDETTLNNQLIILFEDVTEKMVLQQSLIQRANEANLLLSALATAKDYIDKIIHAMADALLVTTISGQIKTVNRATQELFGYSESELINQPLSMIIPDPSFGMYADNPPANSKGGELFKEVEVVCQTKTGQELDVAFSCSVVQTQVEGLQDFVYIGRDITKRKQAEAEIHKALAKEKELHELKSRFISMVSHEFGNPLSTVLMSTELLKQGGEKITLQKKERYLDCIKAATKQMNQLMNDVLVLGKTDAGKLDFQPSPINLKSFCSDLVAEIKMKDGQNHHLLFVTTEASKDSENLYQFASFDEKLLRHILTNLLSNAIKYSPQDSTIEFEAIFQDEAVIFEIKDQGIGIPSEDQKKLFESFYRAKNVGKIPGTGLGLAIVKQAVDIHGGEIMVASEVGVGTTIRVKIPLTNQF
jgi:two-component system sensor histidine kinase VicK